MSTNQAKIPVETLSTQFAPVRWIQLQPIWALFVLIFVFEWLFLIPAVAAEIGVLPPIPPALDVLPLVGWAPGLAAVLVTAATGGRAGVGALFRRLLIWRVGLHWYLFALLWTAVLIVGGLGLHLALGGEMPVLPAAGVPLGTLALLFVVYLGFGLVANTEDIAYRGVALPWLQARYGALSASLILGVLQGLTHLPYFWVPGDFRQRVGFWLFLAFSVAVTLIFTWLYNNAQGSLLIVMLGHAAQNGWSNFLDPSDTGELRPFVLTVVLMWVVAVALVIRFGPARLSHKPESELPPSPIPLND